AFIPEFQPKGFITTLDMMSEPEAGAGPKTATTPSERIGAPDQGDFVDSEDEYEFDEVAEDPELYAQGLYYPTYIGEILANRYRIDHKLGHGGFSVVWMAYDMLSKRDVALKVMVYGDAGEHEYHVQREVANAVSDTSRLLLCQDAFILSGPHGHHRKPIVARMLAAKQLLHGLRALHEGGMLHRDLNSANVMFGLCPLSSQDTTTKYQYIGRPRKMMLPYVPWKPCELVMPMAPQKELITDDVYLGDFGMAIRAGTPVVQKVQSPAKYCAPERVHGMNPSFVSDMWSYMCLFAELYGKYPLFSGSANSTVISFIVDTLGPLPVQWKGLYDAGGLCDPEWYSQHRKPSSHLGLENKITLLRPDIATTEQRLVLDILRWGFSYLPEHRPTAAQLLDSVLLRT
ncbi:kinase-like domain-containing protein, partial [Fusarium flagelliforme]|uniref:kinase-like domain-containing protein n=1 Tax=Fusarium flagelliforme TaxID=2675880 RepID=UPI001E8CDE3F